MRIDFTPMQLGRAGKQAIRRAILAVQRDGGPVRELAADEELASTLHAELFGGPNPPLPYLSYADWLRRIEAGDVVMWNCRLRAGWRHRLTFAGRLRAWLSA